MQLFKLDNTRWFHVVIIILSLIIGYASIKYLGRDNPVEEAAEHVADEMVEIELKLPQDSVHIDLTPDKPYVDNT